MGERNEEEILWAEMNEKAQKLERNLSLKSKQKKIEASQNLENKTGIQAVS